MLLVTAVATTRGEADGHDRHGRGADVSPDQIDERQGEAVGFDADGARYFTVSEGAGAAVHRFVVRPSLAR